MSSILTRCALAGLLAAPVLATAVDSRRSDETPHPLGPHPAIVARRLQATAGYDYASKFYPHPAWLYLRAAPAAEETVPRATAQRPPDASVDHATREGAL